VIKEVNTITQVTKLDPRKEKRFLKKIAELEDANKKLAESVKKYKNAKPKVVEVIKEVPVEIIKEVEVTKGYDMKTLQKMLMGMATKETSRKIVGTTTSSGEAKVVARREVKDGSRTKVTAKPTKASSTKTTTTKGGSKDDLTKIEGVGPKIAELLNNAGINTFAELAVSSDANVRKILQAAGPRFQMHDPGTWNQQAKLAANGKWDQLKKLQDELDGGK